MIKKVFVLIKKVILSGFILYGFNLLISPLSIIIPINMITLLIVTFLGLSGLLGLVIVLLVTI